MAVSANVTVRGAFAQWNLDELSGTTAADSSGNGHDAAYQGGFTLGQTSLTPSGVGKSVLLTNSAGGTVQIPSGFLGSLTRPFSFLAFAKFNSIGRAQQVFASDSGGINFYVGTDGKLVVGATGVANLAIDTRVLSAGTKYLVGFTVSSTGDTYIYVNTTPSAVYSGAVSGSITGVDLVQLGNWHGSGTPFQYSLDGCIQRAIFSNVELSSAEIGAYYAAL